MTDVTDLERELHDLELQFMRPGVRSSRKSLEELLAEDFVEFGSAGDIYDRSSIVSALVLEAPVAWSIASFQAKLLAGDVALVTYSATKGGGESALRSSIWRRIDGRWRMVFHQGTRIR